MTFIVRERPRDDAELRRAIYDGTVFLLPATDASRALVELANRRLRDELGDDPRSAHARLSDEELFARIGRLRREIYLEDHAQALLRDLADSVGFGRQHTAFDPARLRVIAHGAADNPRAAPVYYAHRDTWYAHPSSVVTVWTALDDLTADETFVFYPERFRTPVANDSEIFDYDAWVARGWSLKIGWQDRDASTKARYPQVLGTDDYGRAEGFSCTRGEILLFSGAHFHRTLPQTRGRTRFSLDARLVQLADHARGLGAPNVDGRSTGSALPDYVQPEAPSRA
jgi:hypothetical protein